MTVEKLETTSKKREIPSESSLKQMRVSAKSKKRIIADYQRLSVSTLTMCCTCDGN